MTKQELDAIKQGMKEHDLSAAYLARYLGKSAGWVRNCLNGNYPYYHAADDGKASIPRNIWQALVDWRIVQEDE